MPPKRKAGTAAAKKQPKAAEKNGVNEVESLNEIEEKVSSEQVPEVDEEVPETTKRQRQRRGAAANADIADEPPKKVAKADKKPKDKPEKKGKAAKKEKTPEENGEEFEENDDTSTDKKSRDKPEKKGRAVKKEKSLEENDEEFEEIDDPVTDKKSKDKPEKKGRAAKKEKSLEENDEDFEENDDAVSKRPGRKPKAEKNTEQKGKPSKADKKEAKTKTDKTKEKVPKGKPGRKAKEVEDIEENGKGEEDKEKSEKTLLNPSSTSWEKIDFNCTKKNAKGMLPNLKISCWNIGGLKSWVKKDCTEFLNYESPDILCLQETKCSEEKLPDEVKEITDYKQYWCSSDKEGYAGVGLLSKKEPINISYGINVPDQDVDGRCITAEYDDYYVVCVYVPNAGRKLVTLPKRLEWNKAFKKYVKDLDKKKPVIICGDMNVSHNEIDLARPKSNTKNAGFTEEEREGMTDFLESGYVDTFRELYPEKADMYTFWTYLGSARSKNIGWRLDYFIVSERIMENVCDNVIRTEVFGSDHCPITLFMNM